MRRSWYLFASLFLILALLTAFSPHGNRPSLAQAQGGLQTGPADSIPADLILADSLTLVESTSEWAERGALSGAWHAPPPVVMAEGAVTATSLGTTTRVSVATDGTEGNGASRWPSISADGRYVAFGSGADNLVPDDSNETCDTFVRDLLTGETTLVSIASDGTQGDSCSCYFPSISGDGRYVAFSSDATNLVPDDNNEARDVFVHDRLTGETTRVSVSSEGIEGSDWSWYSSISADGRVVAFSSEARNLVPGDTNDREDTFVHDRLTGETSRVSVSSEGEQ